MLRHTFPFTAVIGQRELKNAIIWNLVNPLIGGALIAGEKGTAKSTLIRGAAEIAHGMAVIEVPLGVTEDRLVGTIDYTHAVQNGAIRHEQGLLSKADGNILYIDEVNLLSDHIVSTILQAAGNKVNIVEREGMSLANKSKFVLFGSMNPEEGLLRGHFLDRFGLFVRVEGCREYPARAAIIEERLKYESNPALYIKQYTSATDALKEKIKNARQMLQYVKITENTARLAAAMASEANLEGHRGDLALIETARAIAALDGRKTVNIDDLREAAKYAFPHRTPATTPLMQRETMPPEEYQEKQKTKPEPSPVDATEEKESLSQQSGTYNGGIDDEQTTQTGEDASEDTVNDSDDFEEAGEIFNIKNWESSNASIIRKNKNYGSGRRNRVISKDSTGRYIKYRIPTNKDNNISDIAFDATVRAAAPFQRQRQKENTASTAVIIEKTDLRVKVRERKTGGCIIFVVDASASMGANRRMKAVKAAIISLLSVSYQKRDKVGMIAFRKNHAEIILGVTSSVELAQKKLRDLPTGGQTPLADGLNLAYEVVMGLRKKDPELSPEIVLVSDGRASGKTQNSLSPFDEALLAAERIGNQGIQTIVIDTENDFIKFHLCEKLNAKLKGIVVSMEELKADGIVNAIAHHRIQKTA